MTDEVETEVERETGEGTDLWRLIAAPIVWAVHFLVCYVGVAVYCEKWGRAASLLPGRWLVAVATLIALVLIGMIFRSLWKVRGVSLERANLDFTVNSPEERHRFLSHVSLMLCVLSIVATLYVALPAFLLETCL